MKKNIFIAAFIFLIIVIYNQQQKSCNSNAHISSTAFHDTTLNAESQLSLQTTSSRVKESNEESRTPRALQTLIKDVEEMNEAYDKEGLLGLYKLDKSKTIQEETLFVKSLGLPDKIMTAATLLMNKRELYALDFLTRKHRPDDLSNDVTPYLDTLRKMDSELEITVGRDVYGKIKYWQATVYARYVTGKFSKRLESHLVSLSSQQQQAVVNAIYDGANGRKGLELSLPNASQTDKSEYTRRVVANASIALGDKLSRELDDFLQDQLKQKSWASRRK